MHATATVVHRSRKVARAGALQLLPPMSVMHYDTPQVTHEHDFMFDLRGYLLLEQAISPELVQSLNAAIDAVPPLEPQQWHGHVHRNDVSKAHCSSPRPRPRPRPSPFVRCYAAPRLSLTDCRSTVGARSGRARHSTRRAGATTCRTSSRAERRSRSSSTVPATSRGSSATPDTTACISTRPWSRSDGRARA
jgi:hypothetical protein